jgi:hypothetical protein
MTSVILLHADTGSAFRLVEFGNEVELHVAPIHEDDTISGQEWGSVAWDCIDPGEVLRCGLIERRLKVLESVASL